MNTRNIHPPLRRDVLLGKRDRVYSPSPPKWYSSQVILHVNISFSVLLGVAFLNRLSLPITAMTIFRDYNYPRNVISIDNRYVC